MGWRVAGAAGVAALVALVVAIVGVGGDDPASSCAKAVKWNGDRYFGGRARLPRAGRVGIATVPCGSGVERVAVYRLRGVRPTIAVAVAGEGNQVFLAEGFLPQLKSHPAHRAVFRHAREISPRGCRGRFALSGTVTSVRSLLLASGGETIALFPHSRTRVFGYARAGEPYLRVGDRIAVRGRHCSDGYGETNRFVDEIRPAA